MGTDSAIQYLHFCGGFGQTGGLPLRSWEQVSIRAAMALHPGATVLLHHEHGSWANAPAECEHVTYTQAEASEWSTWTARHGGHMSDRVRIMALLKYGGLYQDTDSFMLRNCDHLSAIGNTGLVWQTPGRTVVNGFIWQGLDSSLLREVWTEHDDFGNSGRALRWGGVFCQMYGRAYRANKVSVTGLESDLYTTLRWAKSDLDLCFGELSLPVQTRIDNANVFHVMANGTYGQKSEYMAAPAPGSAFEYVLKLAKALYE